MSSACAVTTPALLPLHLRGPPPALLLMLIPLDLLTLLILLNL